jgi:hypothetical protein
MKAHLQVVISLGNNRLSITNIILYSTQFDFPLFQGMDHPSQIEAEFFS